MTKVCRTCARPFETPNVNRTHCRPECRWVTIANANRKHRQHAATGNRRACHAREIQQAGFWVTPELIALLESSWQRGRQSRIPRAMAKAS
jgi:hypothetical protein